MPYLLSALGALTTCLTTTEEAATILAALRAVRRLCVAAV